MKATKVAETSLPTPFGTFRLLGFESADKSESVIALVMGEVTGQDANTVGVQLLRARNLLKSALTDGGSAPHTERTEYHQETAPAGGRGASSVPRGTK